MLTPQKKLRSGWSLLGPSVQNNDQILEKGSNVLSDQEYISVSSQENNEQSMRDKLSELENELHDYQYEMGLLLIEKREWISNYEKLQKAFVETKDTLNRKQAVISDMEKREEDLGKALGVEKQCVIDLEKALHKMRSQHAEIKFTSDLKLAEANALVTGIRDKSLETESKLHAADAKDADLSRKNSDIERKLNEVDFRENALQRERCSFNAEREAQTSNICKQREDLWEWDRKLQEGEQRLEEVQQSLKQRKKLVNENERIRTDLEGAQEKIDRAKSSLKRKEDDIRKRVEKLSFREKESDATRKRLEIKEKELLELEEKLNVRAQVEVQRLLDEHNIILKSKNDDLEFEMEQKTKSLEDDFKSKVIEVEKKVDIVNGMEKKVLKREHELDRKNARLKEREKGFESKFKDLEKRENSLSFEEKEMENEKKKLMLEEEKLFSLRAQIEKSREDVEEERQRIKNESEILKLTEEERLGHSLLQLELKQEIDKCKSQREELLKEREDLKQERDRFEREWEALDDKIRLSDEERDKEIEEMRLESSRIENEKQEISTNQKHLDEKQLEMRRNNDELVSLSNKLKELREQFFKEKEHFLAFVEKHKSCKNCGDPFPEFVHSDLQSIALLDGIKTLKLPNFTDLYSKGHMSIHDRPVSEANSRAVDSGSPACTGTMSWLQKCTSKILTLSSGKKNDPAYTNQNFSRKHVHIESPQEILFSTDYDSELQFGVAEDNLDIKIMQSNKDIREVGDGLNPAVHEQSKRNGEAHNIAEGSQYFDQKLDPPKHEKRGRSGKANVRCTVKTGSTDVKLRGNAPELNKNEHNHSGKKIKRKWSHSGASRRKRSDSDYTYSGEDSDSNIAGGRRKRRHMVVPPVQTTSGQRYNFRQRET